MLIRWLYRNYRDLVRYFTEVKRRSLEGDEPWSQTTNQTMVIPVESIRLIMIICLACLANLCLADNSVYCPQHQAYISYGMNAAQVMAACGPPTYKRQSNNAVVKTTPMTQLIYSNLNQGAGGSVYQGFDSVYNEWSLPSGSTGINLQIDIVNNKVYNMTLNGSTTNAISVCGGQSIQIGADANTVYNACGNPSISNQTFIKQPVTSNEKPEVWVYQMEYRQPMRLIFINGVLQAIN